MLRDNKTPTLLLVEDSDDDAFFFQRTLQKSGATCQVHHVTNGAEAIDFLRNITSSEEPDFPQVIFLDLKMPLLNGFEVLEWMRTQTFPASMQVIVLSGSEHQEDKDRASRLGATDYLVKPVKVSDFHRFLNDVCPPEIGARL
jgi:CheY-like chemotaxis protein